AYTSGLNEDPGWRLACSARSNWLVANENPPTTACTRPVWGSMATRPPPTSGTCTSVHTPVGCAGFLGATQTTSPTDSTSVTALGEPLLVLAHFISSKGISTASRSATKLPSGWRGGRRPTTALARCDSMTTP